MSTARAVDRERFREALAAVCTPVAVVTSHHDGRPHGTTVSAFCSLSLDPPLVLVSLDRASELLSMITEARRYGINVLRHGQEGLALNFARKGTDKFEGVGWQLDRGMPKLDDCATWLVCGLEALHEGGDHMVAVGLVEHAEVESADPLLYRQRTFGTLTAAPEPDAGRSDLGEELVESSPPNP
jgi:flavin reductase (DIM6/NTAB) family NADH-FMN oxidoreductase RutF